MGNTIAEKIIKRHLISGQMVTGQEIALKIDQTLTPGWSARHSDR